ncbi:hypothetical protein D9M72_487290 [compost metagenome]
MAAAGSLSTTVSARAAPRVTPSQCLAAAFHAPLASGPASSFRSFFTSDPVLMSTGQAVWHIPSTAQVSTDSYS